MVAGMGHLSLCTKRISLLLLCMALMGEYVWKTSYLYEISSDVVLSQDLILHTDRF